MKKICIIDYGLGNLKSVKNMISFIGHEAKIISDYKKISDYQKIIIPGVGSFDSGINNLKKMNLFEKIQEIAIDKNKSLLGICLGAQLMLDKSEEGKEIGLSLISGRVESFSKKISKLKINLPVPNMGWRNVNFINADDLIFHKEPTKFYFVHSYFFDLNNENDIWGMSNYGFDFIAAFKKGNIYGVQFHPEKSHKYGIALLKYFIENE